MRRAQGHACSSHRSTDCAVHVQTTSRQPPGGGYRGGGHFGKQCPPDRFSSPLTQSFFFTFKRELHLDDNAENLNNPQLIRQLAFWIAVYYYCE